MFVESAHLYVFAVDTYTCTSELTHSVHKHTHAIVILKRTHKIQPHKEINMFINTVTPEARK